MSLPACLNLGQRLGEMISLKDPRLAMEGGSDVRRAAINLVMNRIMRIFVRFLCFKLTLTIRPVHLRGGSVAMRTVRMFE